MILEVCCWRRRKQNHDKVPLSLNHDEVPFSLLLHSSSASSLSLFGGSFSFLENNSPFLLLSMMNNIITLSFFFCFQEVALMLPWKEPK